MNPGDVQSFLENRYLPSRDPYQLADMELAVARIMRAINHHEVIAVYGDFDADGVTSTVLLTEALRKLVDDRRLIIPYIPDRVDEGYGLNLDALSKLREEKGVTLTISVDCGIRSPIEVAHAKSIGMDMIITDHHSLGPTLPPAVAIINPKRGDSTYPERMLAGVGIAFKLAQALRLAMPERTSVQESDLLDLVALGTVADLAPLLGENRKLVSEGLVVLNEVRRPGIAELLSICDIQPGTITAESIGFRLAPRINAAGRLAHAYDAARLLISSNSKVAREQAVKLEELNNRRQILTRRLSARAKELVDPAAPIIIAGDPEFQSGIVGLVASNLAEQNYRPAIIMEQGEEESRGSCRSIAEFHITEALDRVADLLVRHGGHAQAAGFTIKNENLPEFISRMTEIATDQLQDKDLRPAINIDAEIPLSDIDWALHEMLTRLEPTGQENRKPLLLSRQVKVVNQRVVGSEGTHLQLEVVDGRQNSHNSGRTTQSYRTIAFKQGAWAGKLPDYIDIVYQLGLNHWQGNTTLQLMIEDIRPTENESVQL